MRRNKPSKRHRIFQKCSSCSFFVPICLGSCSFSWSYCCLLVGAYEDFGCLELKRRTVQLYLLWNMPTPLCLQQLVLTSSSDIFSWIPQGVHHFDQGHVKSCWKVYITQGHFLWLERALERGRGKMNPVCQVWSHLSAEAPEVMMFKVGDPFSLIKTVHFLAIWVLGRQAC
jgi:hypothetical protein